MSTRKTNELFSRENSYQFRGIAVIMVVLSHYAEWWSWFYPAEGSAELLRTALTRLGVYGVDLFFLFSGYAMVKSLNGRKMTASFLVRRLRDVYLPYLIVDGAIEFCSGGFTSVRDFLEYLTGWDFWYLFVLFLLYLGFAAIWRIGGHTAEGPRSASSFCFIRNLLFLAYTAAVSYLLYRKGLQPFWYVSNVTFALGALLASYEKRITGVFSKIRIPVIVIGTLGMAWVVRTGLQPQTADPVETEQIWLKIAATMIWTLLMVFIMMGMSYTNTALRFIGKISLYIYLTHTFLFMRCVNTELVNFSYAQRFLMAAVLTVAASWLTGTAVTWALHRIGRTRT